jgi:hypothetical protein
VGVFASLLSGLTANTTYYVRAYATNTLGTAYGNEVTFTTTNAPLTIPVLTTTAVTNVYNTSASSGGTITNDGGTAVTARGVCWSTSPTPTTANSKTTDGTGIGTFTSAVSALTPSTTYYIRAYATNSVGTAYGDELTFTTTNVATTVPTLTTTAISSVTETSASSGGNISADGGSPVTARGVCWSTTTNPTTANSKTNNGTGIGSFTSNITSLTGNTTYYVRAYATNSAGTAYGNQLSFTTPASCGTSVTDIDGNVYEIVQIGTQCWLKQNLKTSKYRNGDPITTGLDNATWVSTTEGAYCYYNDNSGYNPNHGKLYNFLAVNDSRKICPNGWHIPTAAEWTT